MKLLVADRQLDRLTLTRVEPGEPFTALPAGPDDLAGADLLVHRLVYAPVGAPEVSLEPDLTAAEAAGRLEPSATAARLDYYREARGTWPDLPQPTVFDTPFFDALPEVAQRPALPPDVVTGLGLLRRGRHGPLHRLAALAAPFDKVVSVFIGRESSVAALHHGQPAECSAGSTGLEGLPGGTTCGDLDPAVVVYLAERLGMGVESIERALRLEGGLSGVSGGRETLAELRAANGPEAKLAIAMLCHRARRRIGAYAAVLDGLDALVFSADPGYDDPAWRADVIAGLSHLDVGTRVPVVVLSETLATAVARSALGPRG
ncbi:MAG: hypothetical protein HYU66_04355 [Armatimonadetes bacterium]|nr:hypothetical protein [Armatimonadota bacterium]